VDTERTSRGARGRTQLFDSPEFIEVRGAREHNLRDIEIDLPRDQLVVITGLSGSGKSSLAFDTLYAEGQRRYVESLSTYARQFLDQMSKPEVDAIEGLSPAIAIEQKTASRSPRSTVGTVTEVFDYLRLLYARAGDPHCWECGQPISSQNASEMAEKILSEPEGTRCWILAPVVRGRTGHYRETLEGFRKQGFVRVRVDGVLYDLAEDIQLARRSRHDIDVVVDRVVVREKARSRVIESLETALHLADGLVIVSTGETPDTDRVLSQANACPDCGTSFSEIAPRMFSFNGPAGACPECSGLGQRYRLNPDLVVPDGGLALSRAIAPWRSARGRAGLYYERLLDGLAAHFGVSLDTPWDELPAKVRKAILHGAGKAQIELALETRKRARKRSVVRTWAGVLDELERRAAEQEGGAPELDRYRSPEPCLSCEGARLRPEARHVLLGGRGIHEVAALSLDRFGDWVRTLGDQLPKSKQAIAERVLFEIEERCQFLCDVGLGYLSLDRPSATLSGGESQRIRLATQIGSSLMGVLYILDEPSIGLHARDCDRLLESLERLRDMGNSVLVVEHDESTIRRADHVIDMGPGAGIHGGAVVAAGTPYEIEQHPDSPTGAFLSGRRQVRRSAERRTAEGTALVLTGCTENNLQNVTLRVPLGCLVVVTGVSGSGKSTLVRDTLHRALAARLHGATAPPGRFRRLDGAEEVDKVIAVDQAPIGRTPRSNPATYVGAFDPIRKRFASLPESRVRGFGPGHFSFNVKGGRCETCRGDGSIRVEMNFLPDLFVQCEVCLGRRYNRETLSIRYKGRNIADVLELTVEEACEVFANAGAVARPLKMLQEVGLGYLRLGQAATTLSGGEAQRIKLARELGKRATGRTLYLLDEPTTGLHFADVENLLGLLQRLVEQGNTVVVIEHHTDVIASADHVIDLGPEGGDGGGQIVIQGTPEEVAAEAQSHTGRAIAARLA
jgi:excinuclease ABC subunit A